MKSMHLLNYRQEGNHVFTPVLESPASLRDASVGSENEVDGDGAVFVSQPKSLEEIRSCLLVNALKYERADRLIIPELKNLAIEKCKQPPCGQRTVGPITSSQRLSQPFLPRRLEMMVVCALLSLSF